MKKIFIVLLLAFSNISYSQTINQELILLAQIYRSYHFSNTPSTSVFDQLRTIKNDDLKIPSEIISELIKTNNQIATKKYLTKPDASTLKNLFIIRSINWNMHEADPIDNNKLIDSLNNSNTDYLELLSCYYGMVFTAVGNKNQPLDMSNVNLNLSDYNLENDEEKGVFFLESMDTFGMYIWGFMNVVKPPNYKKALDVIKNYPKYNGEPYYQFQNLNFKDFELTIDKREPKKSFKKYYINKYLNTLLYHSLCLSQKKKDKDEKEKVMLGSIMRNESYYKYSDNPEIFQQIFKKIEY